MRVPRRRPRPGDSLGRRALDSVMNLGRAKAAPQFSYVERTRHPSINLLFLMPWLLIYLLCWWSVGEGVETQAAVSLRSLLRLLGRRGLFIVTIATCLGLCVLVLRRLRAATADAAVFPGMMIEGIAYGALLEGAATVLTRLLPLGRWLHIGLFRGSSALETVRNLGIAVGAGIFEEVLFRGILCWGLFRLLKDVLGADKWSSGTIAVVVSAFLFSAYHHWGAGGEPWDALRFTFRFHAGVLLGTIFLTRGLGIAAFAHGFYDALVLLG